jgi:hypothetical protein
VGEVYPGWAVDLTWIGAPFKARIRSMGGGWCP